MMAPLLLLTGFRSTPGPERLMETGDKSLSDGNPDQALEQYGLAIRLRPENASFYLTRGFLLLKLNRLEEAIIDMDAYVRILPGSSQGYISRGMAYSQLKREKEADMDFARACALGDKSGCCFGGIVTGREE